MGKDFITLKKYREKFPDKTIPSLSPELLEILIYRIGRENASFIIKQLAESRLFKFPGYLDQLMAVSLLVERVIPDTAECTVEFWDNLNGFCSALVQYFSSDDGRRMRPLGPVGSTIGKLGGTNPITWAETQRPYPHRRRRVGRTY